MLPEACERHDITILTKAKTHKFIIEELGSFIRSMTSDENPTTTLRTALEF